MKAEEQKAERAERTGDPAKDAELRYGTLMKRLAQQNAGLAELQSER